MLRKDINTAVNNVLQAIEISGVFLVIESCLKSEKQVPKEQLLSSFQHYMHETKSYGEVENEIVRIFDISMIQDVEFWSIIITDEKERTHPMLIKAFRKLRFVTEFLPRILSLLERESDKKKQLSTHDEEKVTEEILTTVLIEENNTSTTRRVIIVLESIDGLYDAVSQMYKIDTQPLSVIACDSGSDKSFDFLGVAKAITCVKEIILSFWDKIIFFHENKSNKQLEVIASSLPIINELAEMEKNNSIEPERAEILRRQIITSISKFSDAGATIPEIEDRTVFNPRQLMKPKPKLLVEPSENAATSLTKPKENVEINDLKIDDPEFEKYMEQMAKNYLKIRNSDK